MRYILAEHDAVRLHDGKILLVLRSNGRAFRINRVQYQKVESLIRNGIELTADQAESGLFSRFLRGGLLLPEGVAPPTERNWFARFGTVGVYLFDAAAPARAIARAWPIILFLECSGLASLGLWLFTRGSIPLAHASPLKLDFTLAICLIGLNILLVTVHEMGHAWTMTAFGSRPGRFGFQLLYGLPAFFVEMNRLRMLTRTKRVIALTNGCLTELSVVGNALGIASLIRWDSALLFLSLCVPLTLFRTLVNWTPILQFDGYYVLSVVTGLDNLKSDGLYALLITLRIVERPRNGCYDSLKTWERFFLASFGGATLLVISSLIKRAVDSLYNVATLRAISLNSLFSLIFVVCAILSCARPISSALILLARRYRSRKRAGSSTAINRPGVAEKQCTESSNGR
jgi:hypothetical protein